VQVPRKTDPKFTVSFFNTAAYFSTLRNRNLTVERILLKAPGHLSLKHSIKDLARGREKEDRGCWLKSLQLSTTGSLISAHKSWKQYQQALTDFCISLVTLVSGAPFGYSGSDARKSKEMPASWQRLYFCKISLPDLSKYYMENYRYSPCQNNSLTWNLTAWMYCCSQLSSLWVKVIAWNNFRRCNLKIRFKISTKHFTVTPKSSHRQLQS